MPSRPERERGTRAHREHAERVEAIRKRFRAKWPFAGGGAQARAAAAIADGRAIDVFVVPGPDPLAPRIQVGGEEPTEPNLSGASLLRALGLE